MKNFKHFTDNFLSIIKYSLFLFIIFSCSLEDGEIGPQGEQGNPGVDGNANVKSLIYDINPLDHVNNDFLVLKLPSEFTELYNKGSFSIYFDYGNSLIQVPGFAPFNDKVFVNVELRSNSESVVVILFFNRIDSGEFYFLTENNLINTKIRVVFVESNS